MAQSRKTRKQKITKSQRKPSPTPSSVASQVASETGIGSISKPHQSEIDATHDYVKQELQRIGWISLLCVVLLSLATLLLADFGWIVQLRQAIGLPVALI